MAPVTMIDVPQLSKMSHSVIATNIGSPYYLYDVVTLVAPLYRGGTVYQPPPVQCLCLRREKRNSIDALFSIDLKLQEIVK
jgi:hypothetical protein